jgi:hypothetical protein
LLEYKRKELFLNFQKISGKFLNDFRGSSHFYRFFSGKISVTALTPLWRSQNTPYIRGDTGRGEGVYLWGVVVRGYVPTNIQTGSCPHICLVNTLLN